MRTIILAGVAALALATAPAFAQDNTPTTTDTATTTTVTPPDQAPPEQSADQANAAAAPAPVTTTVVTDAATGAGAVVTDAPGNLTAPPPSALNKHYPVCTRKLQDSCQNPGEGGAPGHSRALPYWPGKPASEGGR
jgi:hypothetical protein